MMDSRSKAIASAFSSAQHYDDHARIQRQAAEALADRIAALKLCDPKVLEFGCGTGFLTAAMQARGIGGQWLVTDLAPGMVERCRTRMEGRGNIAFGTLDAARETPEGAGEFDLVTASLAAQWIDELDAAVGRMLRWLKPGGHLIFNTLGARTFAEWRCALEGAGAGAGTPAYADLDAIAAIRTDAQAGPPVAEMLREKHGSARAFLRALKGIGAHVPAAGHRPVGPAAMRAAMRALEQGDCTVSYEVVTCHFQRPFEETAA